MRLLLALLAVATFAAAAPPPPKPRPIPVLLLTGKNNHDFEYTSKVHADTLAKRGFAVTVANDPVEALTKSDLRPFKAFVVDYNGPRWGEAAEREFAAWVERGTGVVIIHAANNAFAGWTAYEKMIALAWRDKAGHGKFHPFDVSVSDRNHPITAGFPSWPKHPDELYHGLTEMHGVDYRVLMSAASSRKLGGSGKVEPVALVARYGKGRIFHTTLGHVWRNVPPTRASITDPRFRLLLARGTEWAALGEVRSKPSDFGIDVPAKAGARPISPWVYRCVLDERPRTVVIALDEHLYLAYDAAHCSLFKAWGGRLELKGSVHDDSHGPQPEAGGLPYFEPTHNGWTLRRADRTAVALRPQWRGYRFEGKRVVLLYTLTRPGGGKIDVEESPEHTVPGKPVLERHFVVSGLADGEVLELMNGGAFELRAGASKHTQTFPLSQELKK